MKRLLLAAALLAILVPGAHAAPPTGPPIVPPSDERGTTQLELGDELFAANCVMCHGIGGRGKTKGDPSLLAPPLKGVGTLAADFYLRTGYMPLGDALDQPVRSRPRFYEPRAARADRLRRLARRRSGGAASGPGGAGAWPKAGSCSPSTARAATRWSPRAAS